jgi:hypothetical protein
LRVVQGLAPQMPTSVQVFRLSVLPWEQKEIE